VELLVAMLVTSVIGSAVLAVTLSSSRILEKDQLRNQINQDLRLGLDLLGADIRQAGERLPADFPALEVVNGTSGAPDILIVRRSRLDEVLPVCEDVVAGTTTSEVQIAKAVDPPQGCPPVADDNGDGWPDNLENWRALRLANGGEIKAYIYNPVIHAGEFFIYDADGSTTEFLHKADTGSWVQSYGVSQQCRVYIIEERKYELSGDVLRLLVDEEIASEERLLHGVVDFQIQAVFADGSVSDALGPTDEWSDLSALQVTLTAESEEAGGEMAGEVSARFFPRNVLSL
jgi:type IV pilus assembly protein PilW